MSVIQIKRSATTATPPTLEEGELAFSFLSGNMFIGDGTNVLQLCGLDSNYVHSTGDETVAGNKTFSGDIIISGDLTVNGTVTSVNSTQVDIGDNIIRLNSGETGTPSANAGLEVERGTVDNAFALWDESVDKWGVKIGTGSFTAFSLEGHTQTASTITDFSSAVDTRIGLANINDLADVVITTPTNGQYLIYNDTNWANTSVSLVTTFTGLSDTPSAYTGSGGYIVKVNSGETALEFSNILDGGTF